jgi:hypothetical protein
MLDECHNIEAKIPGQIRSVMNVQEATAKALLVDPDALAAAQQAGDVLGANAAMINAYNTDVRPLLAEIRTEMGLAPDPMAAYAASGYAQQITADRVGGQQTGWGAWPEPSRPSRCAPRARPGTLGSDSARLLQVGAGAHSSAVEHSPYKRGAGGSNPPAPTDFRVRVVPPCFHSPHGLWLIKWVKALCQRTTKLRLKHFAISGCPARAPRARVRRVTADHA